MSDPKLVRIREKLDDLLAVINDKSDAFKEQVRFSYADEKDIEETWGGAKMVVTSAPVKPPSEDADGITWSRFESITWVSTPHAKSLGWVIKEIRDIFKGTLTSMNKYDFYGSLGEAAIAYQDLNEDYETEIGIATAAIEQAYKVLELWEDNIENRPFYYQA